MANLRASIFALFGPGLIVAAAGIGAGDVVTSSVTGARFGTSLCWAVFACVLLKFVLNEGVARWQLATGTTIIEGCVDRLPVWLTYGFLSYLVFWTFFVGGSLTNACGIAGASLFPQIPVWAWGILHSALAVGLVLSGRYDLFETIMKVLVFVMVVTVIVCAVLVAPSASVLVGSIVWPATTENSGRAVLSILGGIGGSMTMLCYGYWMRESDLSALSKRSSVAFDLFVAYAVTMVFAIGLTIVASGCNATVVNGSGMALEVASRLEVAAGPIAKWAFLIGFWCAVFSSMLGVWQGVPYMFADFMTGESQESRSVQSLKNTWAYRGYLFYLAGPPLVLLFVGQPVAMVTLFTIVGSFFMPFLAGLLLLLNNRREWVGSLKNHWSTNFTLIVCLILFGWIAIQEIWSTFTK